MRARDLIIDLPVIDLNASVGDAVRLLAERDLPGLIVVGDDGSPYTVLPGTEVLRLAVPHHFQVDPNLVRVVDEAGSDDFPHRMSGRTLRACLTARPGNLPICGPDATTLQLAVLMTRTRSPLVAVVEGGRLLGALTLNTLLEGTLAA